MMAEAAAEAAGAAALVTAVVVVEERRVPQLSTTPGCPACDQREALTRVYRDLPASQTVQALFEVQDGGGEGEREEE